MKKHLKTKLFLFMCIMTVGLLAGCGGKEGGDDVLQIEPVSQSGPSADTKGDQESEVSKDEMTVPEEDQKQEDTEKSNAEENPGEITELYGDVVSIGEASVVVSKIYIESSAFGEGDVMIVGTGGDNQELINVYFEQDASFTYMTIRNGGQDVEPREGSFSDITEGLILEMTGGYKGEDFWANHADISYVVLGDTW